jgi:hypothetical protein
MMHVFLKDDDESPTETATVAVVTHEPVVVKKTQETPTMILLHKEQQLQ